MYDLILSHGREEVFVYYATAIGDFGRVIEHHIVDEAWSSAVDVLNRQVRIYCGSWRVNTYFVTPFSLTLNFSIDSRLS